MRQLCLGILLGVAGGLWSLPSLGQAVMPLPSSGQVLVPLPKSLGQALVPTAPDPPRSSQAKPVIPFPLIVANSHIIIGNSGLAKVNPQDIKDIVIYKGDNIPARWRTATEGGVINLFLKDKRSVPSKSLAQLRRQLHLAGPIQVEVDGRPLEDTSLRIATAAIANLEVRPPGAGKLATVLNIILAAPKESQPAKYPSGTILIRGMASR